MFCPKCYCYLGMKYNFCTGCGANLTDLELLKDKPIVTNYGNKLPPKFDKDIKLEEIFLMDKFELLR